MLNNLIGNAVKFIPPQGKVTVVAAQRRDGNGSVQVSVADTGPGIPARGSRQDLRRVLSDTAIGWAKK